MGSRDHLVLMKVAVFSTKAYDREFLEAANSGQHELRFFEPRPNDGMTSLYVEYIHWVEALYEAATHPTQVTTTTPKKPQLRKNLSARHRVKIVPAIWKKNDSRKFKANERLPADRVRDRFFRHSGGSGGYRGGHRQDVEGQSAAGTRRGVPRFGCGRSGIVRKRDCPQA